MIRTKYCQGQNRLLPYWGETAQVYSEQVISRGLSHVTGALLSNVVMFVMLITDQSFLSVTVNNGRMLQVTGHM